MSLSHSAKRNRLTWALLALFLFLFSLIVFLHWQTGRNNLAPTRTADSVTRISIERKDQPTIVLEKLAKEATKEATKEVAGEAAKETAREVARENENQWWITSPLSIAANAQRIIPLLTVYTNPDIGYAIDSVDLAATGLQDPEIIVSFNDYPVAIGNQAIDETKRHALHGNRVRFVPDWVLPLLQGGVSAVADLTVFGNELNAITLASGQLLDNEALVLDEESLVKARTLTAQQFVRWPRQEETTIVSEHKASVSVAGKSTQWTLFKTDRYVAMRPDNTEYAYVIPLSDAPWLPQ